MDYCGCGREWAVGWLRPYSRVHINKKAENASSWFSALKEQGKGNGRYRPRSGKNDNMPACFSSYCSRKQKNRPVGAVCVLTYFFLVRPLPNRYCFLVANNKKKANQANNKDEAVNH
jgi:hypothetical protein